MKIVHFLGYCWTCKPKPKKTFHPTQICQYLKQQLDTKPIRTQVGHTFFSNIGPRTKLVQKKSRHVQQPTTSESVYVVLPRVHLYQTCESSPVRRACHTNNPYWSSAIVVWFSCNKCHSRKMYNYTLQTLQIEIAQAILSNHFIVGPIQQLKQSFSQDKVSK